MKVAKPKKPVIPHRRPYLVLLGTVLCAFLIVGMFAYSATQWHAGYSYSQLSAELAELELELEAKTAQKHELEAAIASLADGRQMAEDLISRRDVAELELTELDRSTQALRTRRDELQQTTTGLERRRDSLDAAVMKTERRNAALERRLATLGDDVAERAASLAVARKHQESLAVVAQAAEQRLAVADQLAAELAQRNDEARETWLSLRREIRDLEQRTLGSGEQAAEAAIELEATRKEIELARELTTRLRGQIETLRETRTALNTEIDLKNQSLTSTTESLENLRAQLVESVRELSRTQAEQSAAGARLAELQVQLEGRQADLDRLRTALDAELVLVSQSVDAWRERTEGLWDWLLPVEKREAVEAEVRRLEEQRDALQQEILRLEQEASPTEENDE